MPGRSLFVAIALTAILLFVANVLVGRAARNSVPRQTMRTIDAAPPVIDLLGMGSSTVAAGFDPVSIEGTFQLAGHPVVAVNGALGATGAIEHLLLVRRALQHHIVQQMVYGFADQAMADNTPLMNSDLIGNRALLYYQEPQIAVRYARFNWADLISFQTDRCCALLRERGTLWAKVEKIRRAMGAYGIPPQATNRFGRARDFDLLEASSPEAFVERCNHVMQTGQMLSPPVRELFREARASGVKVTVVEMPIHPSHVKAFYELPVWSEYRSATQRAIERIGDSYIDASHWIPEENEFQDHIHLNPSGAARFSHKLAEQLLAPAFTTKTGNH